jgi:hypothetical protein
MNRILALKRPRRVLSLVVVALACAAAGAAATPALSGARSGDQKPSAAMLRDRDPGARVDGKTIVVSGNGERVTGVSHRPNFMIALGSQDKIIAGSENSQLGALGPRDTILANAGHELVVGGPQGTLVSSGPGHDLLLVAHSDATIDVQSPATEVIVTGHDDQVVCSGDSFNDKIYANRSAAISQTCRRHHDLVRVDSQVALANDFSPPTAHAAGIAYGSGTNFDPYIGTCESDTSGCYVKFPPRTLSGFWSNETVPAYKCPHAFPLLVAKRYKPDGTTVPDGVEISGLGDIGVYIPNALYGYSGRPEATSTDGASATNWTFGSASYQIILHCTNTP